jgi:hypothetical protein
MIPCRAWGRAVPWDGLKLVASLQFWPIKKSADMIDVGVDPQTAQGEIP